LKNLNQIRKKIDGIDGNIVKLIAKRFSYLPAITKYKKELGLPLKCAKRELEILIRLEKQAKALKIEPDAIKSIFIAIFKQSRAIQKELKP